MPPLLRAPYWGSRSSTSSSNADSRRRGRVLLSASPCSFPRARQRHCAPTNPNSSSLGASSTPTSPRAPSRPAQKAQRRALAPAADTTADAATTPASAEPQRDATDRRWMAVALEQARLAGERGEVPIGAVVVEDDAESAAETPTAAALLGAPRGNEAEALCDPIAHAEMLALRSALSQLSAQQRSWRAVLPRATLYATCEPCPMCAGAALACRVGRVVYGARQPRVGADGSWTSLLRGGGGAGAASSSSMWSASFETREEEDGQRQREEAPSAAEPLPPHPYHPNLEVRSGVRADEAAVLLRDFFRRRRRESKRQEEEEDDGDAAAA